MKKVLSLILVFTLAITGVSYCSSPLAWAESIEEVMTSAEIIVPVVETPPIEIEEDRSDDIPVNIHKESYDQHARPPKCIEQEIHFKDTIGNEEAICLSLGTAIIINEALIVEDQNEADEEIPLEQDDFDENIPLSGEIQGLLKAACEEFEVPYALALALIEEETDFRNTIGDGGASSGYMQVQQRWHYDRMNRLGVTDLLDPNSNFRVGLDYLSELYETYGDWNVALTVYNMGHNPGYVSNYAVNVMRNYANWQELTENYVLERMELS